MPLNLPPTRVVPDIRAVQYDGTNAAYIAGCMQGSSVVSDNGSVCEIEIVGFVTYNITVSLNDWVLVLGGVFHAQLTSAQYAAGQAEVLSAAETQAAIVAGIAEIQPVNTFGVANVPTLLGGAQATVEVMLSESMADDGYAATPVLIGGTNLLSALEILSTTVVDETQTDVVVKNNGLLQLGGAKVLVLAIA